MSLRDLKLLCPHYGALVEGHVYFNVDNQRSETLDNLCDGKIRFLSTDQSPLTLSVVEGPIQELDGFYNPEGFKLHISFGKFFPHSNLIAFDYLLPCGAYKKHRRLNLDGLRIGTVSSYSPTYQVFGEIISVDLEYYIDDEGLRLSMSCEIEPSDEFQIPEIQSYKSAQLKCLLFIPRAYFRIKQIPLWASIEADVDEHINDWKALGNGPLAIATNGRYLFCKGRIDHRCDRPNRHPDSSYLKVFFRDKSSEYTLALEPSGKLLESKDGFAHEEHGTHSPLIELPICCSTLNRVLGKKSKAHIELRGDGIGHVNGYNGPWIIEAGGPETQEFRQLTINLIRLKSGLKIKGVGILGPLVDEQSKQPYGPEFNFEFEIPREWILAQGLNLGGYRDEHSAALRRHTSHATSISSGIRRLFGRH